jgi:signal transduction histidine kinase
MLENEPGEGTTGLPTEAEALLAAMVAISSDLDPHHVLDRIVRAACDLTGARYGALGVVGPDRALSDFITHGLTEEHRARIGDLPHGRGILGLVIDQPQALRLEKLQDHPASYGVPANHPPMTTFLGVPVMIRGQVFGNLYLTEKRGGRAFTAQDESLVEALARVAGFVIDNAHAYARSEAQRSWLESVARMTDAVGRPGQQARTLDQVAVSALAAFGGDAVGVLVEADADHMLSAADGRGALALGRLVTEHREDVETAARSGSPLVTDWGIVLPVPTRVHDRVLLVAVPAPADPDRRALMSSFAEQAGLALDRVQALGDRAELAVLTDRERIARDLHDLVIQRLFATGMSLQALRHQLRPEGQDRLDRSIEDLDTTIRDIRSTIFQLQSPAGSARARIAEIVEESTAALGFRPTLRSSGHVDTVLSGDLAGQLEAVLRELLSNAARHAHATQVTVDLRATAHAVELVVTDNGVGIDAGRPRSGLANVARRAQDGGGAVRILDVDPHGTSVSWSVPVDSAGA